MKRWMEDYWKGDLSSSDWVEAISSDETPEAFFLLLISCRFPTTGYE